MGLNTLRTKFSYVLTALLAVALLSFIISADTVMSLFNKNAEPTVLTINGEEVKYNDYAKAHDDARNYEELICAIQSMMYNYRATPSEDRIAQNTADNLVIERLYKPVLTELGVVITDADVNEAIRGFFPDATVLSQFIQSTNSDMQAQRQYEALRRVLELQLYKQKYEALAAEGAFANALELEGGIAKKNNSYTGRIVAYKYNEVHKDSIPAVTEAEIEAYYNTHKGDFEQTPRTMLKYVEFKMDPTEGDRAAIEERVKVAFEEFKDAKNLEVSTINGVNVTKDQTYTLLSSLDDAEAKALKAGRAFGPELVGDMWRASRSLETISGHDSVKINVVALLPTMDADSLYTAAQATGAEFDKVVEGAMPLAPVQMFSLTEFPVELAKAVRTARKGEVKKLENMPSQFGPATWFVKVEGVGRAKKQYVHKVELGCSVKPSQETIAAIEAEAKAFASAAHGSLAAFDAALQKDSLTTYHTATMPVTRGKRTVSGFANATDVARWVDGAGVGSVSNVLRRSGGDLVVAVVTDVQGDHKSLKSVEATIKQRLLNEKKFDYISEKMQGATIEEAAAAAGKKVLSFKDAKIGGNSIQGVYGEARVDGALAAATEENKGKLSSLIEGRNAAYLIVVDEIKVEADTTKVQTVEAERERLDADKREHCEKNLGGALKEQAEVKDNSLKFF